jgi:hypothetical protein
MEILSIIRRLKDRRSCMVRRSVEIHYIYFYVVLRIWEYVEHCSSIYGQHNGKMQGHIMAYAAAAYCSFVLFLSVLGVAQYTNIYMLE